MTLLISLWALMTKTKLVLRKYKCQQNEEIYGSICDEMKEDFWKRSKKGALTIKSGTGIKRFQEDKSYGEWFCAAKMKINSYSGYKPLNTTRNNKKVSCMLFYHKSNTSLAQNKQTRCLSSTISHSQGNFPVLLIVAKILMHKKKTNSWVHFYYIVYFDKTKHKLKRAIYGSILW